MLKNDRTRLRLNIFEPVLFFYIIFGLTTNQGLIKRLSLVVYCEHKIVYKKIGIKKFKRTRGLLLPQVINFARARKI